MKTKDKKPIYAVQDIFKSHYGGRDFIENIKDHIIITDSNGIVQYANKATEIATGFLQKDIIGKKAGELWGGNMPKSFYEDMWRTIKIEKKSFVGTVRNIRRDGKQYHAELRIYPVLDAYGGEVRYFIGIEPDITERVEEDEKRSEFISLATHQLKSPLTTEQVILGILENSGKNLTSEQKKLIEQIRDINKNLAECIRDLLIISRLDSNKKITNIDFEKFSFASFMHKIIEAVDHQAKEKKVNVMFAYAQDIILNLPENILRQAVLNLVINAIYYSPPKQDVLMAFKEENGQVVFMCRDYGIGIPQDEKEEIFKPFFRASNAKTMRDGTGLGLFIVQKLCDEIGCRVWFESEENKGSVFYISIPLGSVLNNH